ncbi:MAG: P1 family peptidase [Thermomicrobiales bacterium]
MVTIHATPRDVHGVRVGHVTNENARTGTTVIAFDAMALTAVEVRGSAPGSLNTAMLEPGMAAQRVDALVLTGGSAFGLRTADGVMEALQEQGRGLPFGGTTVPLVAGAVIFDLAVGTPIAPTAEDGRAALEAALPLSQLTSGHVGVGTGASVGTAEGAGTRRRGGFGVAQADLGFGTVTAFVALNALGTTLEESILRGHPDPRIAFIESLKSAAVPDGRHTTLIALVTDIPCSHDVLIRCCVAAHDALARMIVPTHTIADGDIAFASTLQEGAIDREHGMALTFACELATEAALRHAAALSMPA